MSTDTEPDVRAAWQSFEQGLKFRAGDFYDWDDKMQASLGADKKMNTADRERVQADRFDKFMGEVLQAESTRIDILPEDLMEALKEKGEDNPNVRFDMVSDERVPGKLDGPANLMEIKRPDGSIATLVVQTRPDEFLRVDAYYTRDGKLEYYGGNNDHHPSALIQYVTRR